MSNIPSVRLATSNQEVSQKGSAHRPSTGCPSLAFPNSAIVPRMDLVWSRQ